MKICLAIIVIFLSCSKGSLFDGYPGLDPVDLISGNDCSLPACSHDRIVRYELNDMEGSLTQDSIILACWGDDSCIEFRICNPEIISFAGGLHTRVKCRGVALDACGFWSPQYLIQEVYFLELFAIEEL